MPEPHVLHSTLEDDGCFYDLRLDCPHDTNDPNVERSCRMIRGEGSYEFEPGCGGQDWLMEAGFEVVWHGGVIDDPVFPMNVDVKWVPGGECFGIFRWEAPDA